MRIDFSRATNRPPAIYTHSLVDATAHFLDLVAQQTLGAFEVGPAFKYYRSLPV
jgi:hypothetical protein